MKKYMITLVMLMSSSAHAYVYSDYTWQTYNGHQYAATFVVGPWEDAHAEAAAIGANLVTINDSLENAWLTERFDNISSTTEHSAMAVWIGLRQVDVVWSWLSGEPVTYWNVCDWCFRDPGPHMYLHTASHGYPGTWNYNNWHDTRPTHYLHGVIELSEPTTGPVAYWSFDDVVDPGHDDSGNGHNGTIYGNPSSVDGICGKGLYFDGSGDYVDVPDAPGLNPTSAITVAAWIKVSSFPGTWPPIVKKYDGIGPHHGYALEFNSSYVWFLAQLEGGFGHTDYSMQIPIDSSWRFVVGVYDGSAFTLYVDGVPRTPQNFTGNIVTSSYNLNIGRDPYLTNRFFDGVIDEVRIYDRALSAEEIAKLMPEPNIAVSPLSHDFGDVELGTSSTVIVTISNVGNGGLNVSGIALETDFAITSVPPASVVVEPSETVDVEVTYTPTVLGYNSAVLKITSDDPDEPVVEVQLSAAGVEIPPPPSEQIANILAFFDTSVGDGTLAGDGQGKSVEKRLNALRNMIEAAGDLIENELFEEACQQLLDVYRRMDGQPRPPDFVKGEVVPELASKIQDLMTSLGCE